VKENEESVHTSKRLIQPLELVMSMTYMMQLAAAYNPFKIFHPHTSLKTKMGTSSPVMQMRDLKTMIPPTTPPPTSILFLDVTN